MRTGTLIAFCILTVMDGMICLADDKIQWLRSAQKAAEVAAQTQRPILIYVRSADCYYCDLMQRDVWSDPATVARIQRDFVPLKLTREENAEAVKAMQVKGFPSTLIFSADRKFAHRVQGYLKPDELKAELDKAARTAGTNPGVSLR